MRSEASNRFEKQLHPELAIRAQRVASKLMVELCGAKLVPGTIDAAAELPPARRVRLRPRRADSLLGMRIEPELCATYLERLGFGVEREGDDLMAEVPVHRYYDVSREADLVEEVGRIHGYDEHLPATLPQAPGQGGRLSREQSLRRRAEDVMRDLGFDAVVSLSLADPGLPGRLRLPEGDVRRAPIRVSNPLSLEHSELRTTLLGSLLDAARYNLARGAERVALFESGRAYLAQGSSQAGGVLGGEFAGERRPPAFEPHCIAALAAGPLAAPSWGATARPTDFFALKGVLEALAAQLGASVEFEPQPHPFLHPGRAARVLSGRPRGRMARRGPSARLPRVGSRGGDRIPGPSRRAGGRGRPSASSSTRTSRPIRRSTRTWPSSSARTCRPPGCGRRCWPAAASCSAAQRSSTCIAASRWVRGARASRFGSSSAPPTAPSPTPRSPSGAKPSRRRSQRSAGRSVSERRILVAGASGFTGALAASLVWRHPRLELAAATSRGDAGTRLDRLYPRHRVPVELEELDLRRAAEFDAAIVAYPHGAAAELVGELRSAGLPVVDVSADFRLHDLATYEGTYGDHGAPQLLADAVYGLPELHRDRIAGAQLVANPGCYPTAALLALAPLAQAGLIDDVVISAASGVSGAGRGGGERLHFVTVDENFSPYGVDGHRHAPEIVQELAGMGGSAPVSFVPHLLPLDQGLLASCYVRLARDLGEDELRSLYEERYGRRAVRGARRRAARRSRRAGHEPLPHPRLARRLPAGRWSSPRSTTSGRGRPARRSRT